MSSPPNDGPPDRLDQLSEDRRRLFEALRQKQRAAASSSGAEPPPPPPPSSPGAPPGASGPGAPPPPGPGANPWGAPPGGWPFGTSAPPPPPPSGPWTPLVSMKPSGSRPPFFCVHAMIGSVFPYHALAMHLGAEQPFHSLQARGLDGVQPPLETIEEMAEAYLAAVRSVRPQGPYHLGGYSFGGLVALEMAHRLLAQGERVAVLAMLGTGAPPLAANGLAGTVDLLARQWSDFQRLAVNTAVADGVPGAEAFAAALRQPNALPPLARITTTNSLAALRYTLRPYPGNLDVFTTSDMRALLPADASLGWKQLCTGTVETHAVGGTHLSMFQEPEVRDLALQLTRRLERADAAPSP